MSSSAGPAIESSAAGSSLGLGAPVGPSPSSSSGALAFSPALFKSLVDALQPTDISVKIITTIALGNLGHAQGIVDIIERRMHNVGLASLALRMLWVIIDALLKAQPLVYGPLFTVHIPLLVETRVPWESEDALAVSLWLRRLVASWQNIMPYKVWRSVHDGVRQRTARMFLDRREDTSNGASANGGGADDGGGFIDIESEAAALKASHQSRAATSRQLEGLRSSWESMVSMVAKACGEGGAAGGTSAADGSPSAKRHRPEGGNADAADGGNDGTDGANNGAEEDDEEDFSLGDFDPNALVLDANGNPIMALQEIQLPVTARQPRRRR